MITWQLVVSENSGIHGYMIIPYYTTFMVIFMEGNNDKHQMLGHTILHLQTDPGSYSESTLKKLGCGLTWNDLEIYLVSGWPTPLKIVSWEGLSHILWKKHVSNLPTKCMYVCIYIYMPHLACDFEKTEMNVNARTIQTKPSLFNL